MTEQEIIDFLKKNKETGIAFAFMPKEVQDWINDASRKIVYLIFKSGLWEELPVEVTANEEDVFALPDSFQLKQEQESGWFEYEIDKNGNFYSADADDKDGRYYHWSEWNTCLANNKDNLVTFGGWQYKDSKNWYQYPILLKNNGQVMLGSDDSDDVKPAIPIKIRFWRESQ